MFGESILMNFNEAKQILNENGFQLIETYEITNYVLVYESEYGGDDLYWGWPGKSTNNIDDAYKCRTPEQIKKFKPKFAKYLKVPVEAINIMKVVYKLPKIEVVK